MHTYSPSSEEPHTTSTPAHTTTRVHCSVCGSELVRQTVSTSKLKGTYLESIMIVLHASVCLYTLVHNNKL